MGKKGLYGGCTWVVDKLASHPGKSLCLSPSPGSPGTPRVLDNAARPTFEPAKGGMGRGERDLSALSKQYSARDLASHTRLKYRDHGQNTTEELRNRDFRRELEDRERATVRDKRTGGSSSSSGGGGGGGSGSSSSTNNAIRESASASSSSSSSSKKPRLDQIAPSNLDADDPQDDDDDGGSDSDDSDDEATLFAELERIRRERAEEDARKQQERQEQEERIRMENIISGNPLLNLAAAPKAADMKVKKRWDDDVVFKNCAASEPDKTEQAFINDSLRSEFHKRFMEKYVK
ncbi:Protein CWC15 [Chionoecetes opilio]|uniref:Protein CWC15 n=1 Tax=Chionoecetes opilio TaxID=41210 RepID=A0A8J4YB78_CHIOP|nr:Protein CWC15 [Chionoecetes opilio]